MPSSLIYTRYVVVAVVVVSLEVIVVVIAVLVVDRNETIKIAH